MIDAVSDAIIFNLEREVEALEAEVERLRAQGEKELDYSIALQRIIEGTRRGELSSLIPDNLYHLKLARETIARIPDPDDLRVFAHPSQYTSWQYHSAQERVRTWLATLPKGES